MIIFIQSIAIDFTKYSEARALTIQYITLFEMQIEIMCNRIVFEKT